MLPFTTYNENEKDEWETRKSPKNTQTQLNANNYLPFPHFYGLVLLRFRILCSLIINLYKFENYLTFFQFTKDL